MYLKRIVLTNIKSFEKLVWDPELPDDKLAGWHVIIGDNGAGKTSFVRSIALGFVGPREAPALDEDWKDWVQRGKETAQIDLRLIHDPKYDKFSYAPSTTESLHARLTFRTLPGAKEIELVASKVNHIDSNTHIWGGHSAWFSAAYGPFHRFTGGDESYGSSFSTKPRLVRHLSIFSERVALTESIEWLQDLDYKFLDAQRNRQPENDFLYKLIEFINQESFLPYHTRLTKISSEGIEFEDGNGAQVLIKDLSDGYRSILSMTIELIRQLSLTYGQEAVFSREHPMKIGVPGVVLIDEVDVHLHPTWQRRIGLWLIEHFPHIQFIVTTHSPLICQAANVGTVYQLPQPGSEEQGSFVAGMELDRLLYGNVLDAYSTGLFGDSSRSEEGKRRLTRLAVLNQKELHNGLTESERREQEELRASLPTAANTI